MLFFERQDGSGLRTTLLRSADDFARISGAISELRRSTGAGDDLYTDPEYVLTCADRMRRPCSVACWRGEELVGVLFAFQHYLMRCVPTGYVAAGDYSGRGAMIARCDFSAAVVSAAVERLKRAGAHSVMLRITPALSGPLRLGDGRSTGFHEIIPGDRLPLAETYTDFLGGLGKHTRRNLRYYTRRVASAGISFDPDVPEAEYTAAARVLNTSAEFPIVGRRLARDLRLMQRYQGQRFALRDASGAIVAVLCGFAANGRFYLLSQVNDARLAPLSLSLVLRGFTIEHLIGQGVRELQFMGGTSLALGRFCERLNYSSYFVERPHFFFSPLKRTAALLVEVLDAFDRPVPASLDALCGAYLTPGRLAARTPLRPAALVNYEDRLRREKLSAVSPVHASQVTASSSSNPAA